MNLQYYKVTSKHINKLSEIFNEIQKYGKERECQLCNFSEYVKKQFKMLSKKKFLFYSLKNMRGCKNISKEYLCSKTLREE